MYTASKRLVVGAVRAAAMHTDTSHPSTSKRIQGLVDDAVHQRVRVVGDHDEVIQGLS